ncbi:MAG TPA: hypothetical protein VFD43_11505 [Planctomycetota bacterium]|nr:hypothetical protein [Planctomycetota bacterium]
MLLAPGLDSDPVPEAFGAAPDAYPGVYLIQIAVDLATIALVMLLARRRFGPRAARWAGWIGALYPQSILLSSGLVLAEGAAAFASALALLALDALDRRLEQRAGPLRCALHAAVVGVLLGVGILTKEILLPVTAVFAAALFLRPATSWRQRAALAAGTAAVAFLVALPWALYNRGQHGVLIWSGTFSDYSLAADNAPPGVNGARMWRKRTTIRERHELARQVFRDCLLVYPGLTAQRALVRLRIGLGPDVMLPAYAAMRYEGFQPDATDDFSMSRSAWTLPAGWGRRVQLLCGLGTVALFALAVAGLCAAPRGTLARAFVLMTLALYVTIALTVADGRYRHGLLPFALPFAGLAAALLFGREERERWEPAARRRALIGGLAAAAVLVTTVLLLPAP